MALLPLLPVAFLWLLSLPPLHHRPPTRRDQHGCPSSFSQGEARAGGSLSDRGMTEELSTKTKPQRFLLHPQPRKPSERNTPQIPLFGMREGLNGEKSLSGSWARSVTHRGLGRQPRVELDSPKQGCIAAARRLLFKDIFSKPGLGFGPPPPPPNQNTRSHWKCSVTLLLKREDKWGLDCCVKHFQADRGLLLDGRQRSSSSSTSRAGPWWRGGRGGCAPLPRHRSPSNVKGNENFLSVIFDGTWTTAASPVMNPKGLHLTKRRRGSCQDLGKI